MLISDIDDFMSKRLIEFNDNKELVYPFIRWNIIEHLTGRNEIINSQTNCTKLSFKEKVNYFTLNFTRSALKINKQKDIIFFAPSLGNSKVINGKYFNRLCDYYVLDDISYAVIEQSTSRKIKYPRYINGVYYRDFIGIGNYIKDKLFIRPAVNKNKKLSSFSRLMYNEQLFEDRTIAEFNKKIIGFDKRMKSYERYFKKIFQKIKPKIIFLHAATYGGLNAYITKWAKDLGIKVAEFQHGIIAKTHYVYNFGNNYMENENYKKYSPDYLLLFGDYWCNQINTSSQKIVIGNPQFYESIKKHQNIDEDKNTILIVSQWTITEEMVDIAKHLSEKLDGYKIVFKLHPGEIKYEDSYNELDKYPNIEIIKNGDIYELIAKCEYIVACYSTAIFEAMGFNKKMFILDNSFSQTYMPKNIGKRFNKKEELKELILNYTGSSIINNLDYYFNSNWKDNYHKFLKNNIENI